MNNKSVWILAVLVAMLALGFAQRNAVAQTFSFENVEIAHAESTDVQAINNGNVMVGWYQDSSGNYNGVMISGHTITIVSDPDGVAGSTTPYGINNNGAIVGAYTNTATGNTTGFLYENGTFTDVIFPGANATFANGINDSGEIAGNYFTSDGAAWGFLYSNGNYTSLQAPNSLNSLAWGINNSGLITVQWQDASLNTEASIYNSVTEKYITADVPGAVNSNIHDINNHNHVVYSWNDASGNFHGALLRGKTFYTFDDPNTTTDTRADGINDSEIMVGRWEANGGSEFQSFAAKFVP